MMSRAIERGLRRVRLLASCEVEDAPRFDAATKGWIVSLWLRIEQAGAFVGTRTKWCVLIDEMYPYGRIAFYPAVEGGLTSTFPHQDRNTFDGEHQGWRQGKLCLDTPFRGERCTTVVRDPVGDADERLRWHVERALAWLRAAAADQLLANGDPFEIPSRPHTEPKEWAEVRIVHDESEWGFGAWANRQGAMGEVELGAIPGIGNVVAIRAFIDDKGATIRTWGGRPLERSDDAVSASWWLWPRPIVVPPWLAPDSWGDLRKAGRSMGIDVDARLQRLAPTLRGRKADSILLLGYPMPQRVGSAPREVHWDAILLPRLSPAEGKPPNGFRSNSRGWWQRDRIESFADRKSLVCLRIENWGSDRLQARGRLQPTFRGANVAVIGVGALGSALAEQMVRAGLSNIALIDDDSVAAGNVCRHVATLADVGHTKVRTVARRLLQISPLVRVSEFEMGLPSAVDRMVDLLEPFDLVVDCSGSDDVLALLARGWWSIPRIFASFSLGFGAQRLFSFGVFGHRFPADRFENDAKPWLRDETSRWASSEELLEGPGCWSPLFPARCDDVLMAASGCVKELETMTDGRPREPRFRVFEKRETDEGFVSFSVVQKTEVEEPATP